MNHFKVVLSKKLLEVINLYKQLYYVQITHTHTHTHTQS